MKSIREQGREFGKKMKNADRVAAIMFVIEAQKENSLLDSTTIVENAEIFPKWNADVTGKAGEIYNDGSGVYRIKTGIKTPVGKKPSKDPANWELIGDTTEIYPEWSKPIGTKDAYQNGDCVTFNGVKYTSEINDNTYEPDIHGWKVTK